MTKILPSSAPYLRAVSSDVDVAIVGAGAAGIAAARYCLQAGLTCSVLEARDRVGGRCVTSSVNGVSIDLGAHWLHAGALNPLVALGRERGEELWPAHPKGRLMIGGQVADNATAGEFQEAFEKVGFAIEAACARGEDKSLEDVLPELGRWYVATEATFALISGRPLREVSAQDFPSEEFGDNWFVKGGYGAYLARLADGLPIALNAPVERIDWSGERVALEAPDGTVRARVAIITVPTPLLARIRFVPGLPPAHRSAIDGFLPGTYEHIVLDWAGSPFREHDRLVKIVGRESSYGVMTRLEGSDLHFLEIDHETAEEHRRDPTALAAFARHWLSGELGSEAVRGLDIAHVTNWFEDPWSRAAWAVAAPGRALDRATLAEPVGERIWIAGEATSRKLWGTVGGAWQEGERAAMAAVRRAKKLS